MGYGLFQKKTKEAREGWGHRFSRDIKLKERTCANPRDQLSRGSLVIRFVHGRTSYDV